MAIKKISVELLQDIAHIGRKGEVIEVSSSQARNSLIPKGFAREMTQQDLFRREASIKKTQDTLRQRKEAAFDIQKILDMQELTFSLKGKGNKVFGGLGQHEILQAIAKKFDISFEKKDIKLPNGTHIKTPGRHLVYIHITHHTIAKIFVVIELYE